MAQTTRPPVMPASPSLGPGEPGLLPRQAAASALVPVGLRVSPRCWVERGRPPSSRGSGLLRRGRLCHSRCGSAAVSSVQLCPPCFLELCWAGHRGRPRHPQRFELQRGCEGPRVLPASPAWLPWGPWVSPSDGFLPHAPGPPSRCAQVGGFVLATGSPFLPLWVLLPCSWSAAAPATLRLPSVRLALPAP